MNGVQNSQPNAARPRQPRLSPELNELLHMLDALEGQIQTKDAKPTSKS